jgi:hypothetical protein
MAATGTLQNFAVSTGNSYFAYSAGVLNSISLTEAQFTSPQVTIPQSWETNYAYFGNGYDATVATLDPAYKAEAGFVEAYSGLGIQSYNSGQTLSFDQRAYSTFEGVQGTVGTVGIGLGVSSIGSAFAGSSATDTSLNFTNGNGFENLEGYSNPVAPSSQAPVVIGENMAGRVQPFADQIGGETYVPGPYNNVTDALQQQQAWIQGVANQGRVIIDIGPDLARPNFSIYYDLETTTLEDMNYPTINAPQPPSGPPVRQ